MSTAPRTSVVKAAPRFRTIAWRAALGVIIFNILAALFAITTDWRGRFGASPDQGSIASQWALNGSAISAPIAPLALLAAGALLARRRDRWGVLGLIAIAIAGTFFTIGAIGEIVVTSPPVPTPDTVLIISSCVHAVIGLTLIVLAALGVVRR